MIINSATNSMNLSILLITTRIEDTSFAFDGFDFACTLLVTL
ncbi:hypothetical protein BTN50_0651 [Candidatus Enterovibrio altilux]|uniref:Uncharacterized protein n=1 Tax=Candidatus Enterovibrio altilux TaxID=1927128 RepID=A0A291B856_9GAMM|nr:hypothetical protein BTN50_0651 [Candidatus Enterovibrio luxaltus]